MTDSITTYTCLICGAALRKNGNHGRRPTKCAECRRTRRIELQRIYYKNNRERLCEQKQKYEKDNREKINGKKREYRRKTGEHKKPKGAAEPEQNYHQQCLEVRERKRKRLLKAIQRDQEKKAGSSGKCLRCKRVFIRRFRAQQYCRRPGCLDEEQRLLAPISKMNYEHIGRYGEQKIDRRNLPPRLSGCNNLSIVVEDDR